MSKVQTMRKEAEFEVTDHIVLSYAGNDVIADIFARFGDEIAGDTLADTLIDGTACGFTKEWNINGETVMLGIERAQ